MSWTEAFARLFVTEKQVKQRVEDLLRRTPVPVFWLFGKAQTGKSSIVKYLTGVGDIDIGQGFRPVTRHSHQYDFPSSEAPAARFIDTRGLGEGDYDPAEDIAHFDATAHAMIVTVPLTDFAQEAVLAPLKRIREGNPHRPVVLALTCLHRALPPPQQHPPYPFHDTLDPADLLEEWRRPLAQQRQEFAGLVDVVVPIDLTHPDDGFANPQYGGDRLRQALADVLPDAQREAFRRLEEVVGELKDLYLKRALPWIAGASALAATAAAVPIPYLDLPAVTAFQVAMVRQVASVYGQQMTLPEAAKLYSAVGGVVLSGLAIRELLKIIPFVGEAASVAMASAVTAALGRTCCWYFGEVRNGHVPTRLEFERAFRAQRNLLLSSPNGHAGQKGSTP
jgi:uncharacterized protein (DUF697 family)